MTTATTTTIKMMMAAAAAFDSVYSSLLFPELLQVRLFIVKLFQTLDII